MAITDKIIKIADKTRELTGITEKMTLDEIPIKMDLIKVDTGSEDITEELDMYEVEVTEQKTSISSIIELLQTKSANSSVSINLFIQESEPRTKDGIWIQSSDTSIPNKLHLTGKNNDLSLGSWNDASENEQLPYDFYLGSTAIVGTDIYIFFNQTASGVNALYKYDTLTNKYTRLSDVPFNSNRSTASVIGTDIYIFGSSASPYNLAYKYDTLTDAYTQLASAPYNVYNATSVAYKDSIYLFGSASSAYTAYRYDILNNTYTQLPNAPIEITAGRAAIVDDDIYLFGVGASYLTSAKYNITSNSYVVYGAIYSAARCLPVSVGTYIYIFGSSYTDGDAVKCYIFDTVNLTGAQVTTIPFKFGQGGGGLVGDKIYLMGSKFSGETKKVQTINVNTIALDEDSILLTNEKITKYKTKISSQIDCDFSNCYLYKNNEVTDIESSVYYGDGTKWTKIN